MLKRDISIKYIYSFNKSEDSFFRENIHMNLVLLSDLIHDICLQNAHIDNILTVHKPILDSPLNATVLFILKVLQIVCHVSPPGPTNKSI